MTDAVTAVDAMVAAIGPRLGAPVARRRDVVLVAGPWLAGVSSVAAVLRDRLPDRSFVEPAGLAAGEAPTAVVFVVSAAAELTGSDRALLDAVAQDTDVVIGVVSKIDVHRNWRDTLDANRAALTAHAPRYRGVAWVGAAAAPAGGEPRVDDLIAALTGQLGDPAIARRNRLRAWESQLRARARRHQRDAVGCTRVEVLRGRRDTLLRRRRRGSSERAAALRGHLQQARVQLSYVARNRCAAVRSELAEDAAAATRATLPGFAAHTRRRVGDVVADVDDATTARLADVARALGLPVAAPPVAALPRIDVGAPLLQKRKLESRLMLLLGAAFGLGAALTLSRLLVNLAPGLTTAGFVACLAVGLALTVWVVGARSLLADRALLDRWVGEVIGSLRAAVEQLVAIRVLAAESVFGAALGDRDEAENEQVAEQIAVIDAELREHAAAGARAAGLLDRETPALRAALDAVLVELGEPGEAQSGLSRPAPSGSWHPR